MRKSLAPWRDKRWCNSGIFQQDGARGWGQWASRGVPWPQGLARRSVVKKNCANPHQSMSSCNLESLFGLRSGSSL
eukprot:7094646-Pyramimonas_sp.AAC.1